MPLPRSPSSRQLPRGLPLAGLLVALVALVAKERGLPPVLAVDAVVGAAHRRRLWAPGKTYRNNPIRVWLNPAPVCAFLDERDISQNEFARLSGISPGHLSQLMSGARCPSPQVRRRLLRFLGLSDFDDLFITEWDAG